LSAARGVVEGNVWAVFQPHLYSRTARFHAEFGEALSQADEVVITDVYGSREEPVPGVTGELVADAARGHGSSVHYVPHLVDLAGYLADRVSPGDLVLTMGAGDITLVPTELAMRLAERP
jgi:UDP-N-acetylmuramate--alanine ligase